MVRINIQQNGLDLYGALLAASTKASHPRQGHKHKLGQTMAVLAKPDHNCRQDLPPPRSKLGTDTSVRVICTFLPSLAAAVTPVHTIFAFFCHVCPPRCRAAFTGLSSPLPSPLDWIFQLLSQARMPLPLWFLPSFQKVAATSTRQPSRHPAPPPPFLPSLAGQTCARASV